MKKIITASLLSVALSFSLSAVESVDPIKVAIEKLGLSIDSISSSPIKGMATVMTDRGLIYVSNDGKYLFHGNLFNLDKGMVNETELTLSSFRANELAKLQKDAIVYKAKDEKYSINVFTDITCGYCRKLHQEIASYNNLGITVRYFAFPRGGINSESYTDMVSVWCAADKKNALDEAKLKNNIVAKTCSNTVKEQYDMGGRFGVTGTPAIILDDGSLIPGYRPAPDLLKILQG